MSDDSKEVLLRALAGNERKVIEALYDLNGEATQSQLMRQADIPRATLSRILADLESRGIIKRKRKGISKKVRLDEKLLRRSTENTTRVINGKSTRSRTVAMAMAVIVVVAGVGTAAYLLLTGGEGGSISDIPVYPGVIKLNETETQVESGVMQMAIYSFTGDGADIFNWYISEMPQRGWIRTTYAGYLENDYLENEGGELRYLKGNDMVSVSIIEGTEAQIYGADKVLIIGYTKSK